MSFDRKDANVVAMKSEFNRYLDAIQPTRAQRNLAKEELEFLEGKLSDYISDDDPYKFVKALRSGSFAKATALRRSDTADFDADIAIYLEDDGSERNWKDLIAYIERLTRRAYERRTTRRPRFDPNESCVRAEFSVTPKINIDIVPIVAINHPAIPNWGVLPKRDGTLCYTSVSEHIEFVRSRNDPEHGVPFRKQVRLLKIWRNGAFSGSEQGKVSSFFLELILGKAFDQRRCDLTGDALGDLSRMIAWIIHDGLESVIHFPDSRVPLSGQPHPGPVVVLDPVNPEDNVAAAWTVHDRDRFLDRLDVLGDVLRDAELECAYDLDQAIEFVDQALPRFRDMAEG